MDSLVGNSGRVYTPLPIDPQQGFPQVFSFQVDNRVYRFTLYVDMDAGLLAGTDTLFSLPATDAFLVVKVERTNSDGTSKIVFLRKVTPEQEYEAENIALIFPMQTLARNNINGQGDFGSQVVGGIAPRWA